MTADAKSNIRVLAAGAEKVVPKAAEEKRAEEPARGSWFVRRIGPLVAGLALVCAPAANTGCSDSAPPVEDADAGEDVAADVDSDLDSDVGPEVDADEDVGPETDAEDFADEGETLDDSGEAEASCPTTTSVSEAVEAPGPIGELEQTITEIYEFTNECDGTLTRGNLLEVGINLSSPASPEQLGSAVAIGSDTVIFGERVRLTAIGVDGLEYGKPIPGAERTIGLMGTVDDGVHVASVRNFVSGERVTLTLAEVGGEVLGEVSVLPGEYASFPSGRVVMVTDLRYDPIDPLGSLCHLTMLEAPVNVPNGETVGHGGGVFRLGTADESGNLTGLRLVRE